jgi:MFS family permease
MLLPQVAGMIVSATWGGRHSVRSGQFKRYLVVGVGLETVALALLVMCALMKAGSPPFLVALAILGLGTGLGMPNAVVIVQNAVPRETLGTATGSMSFVRSLGGAVGVALSGCVMRFVLGSGSTMPGFEGLTVDRALRVFPGDAEGIHPMAEALRFAIASSFAFGAAMMLAALVTCAALPARVPGRASHDD